MTILEQIEQPVEQKEATRYSVAQQLTTGSLLARNTVWNLVGQFAPMVVAVVAIPRLIRGLGTDRFGALTIAWMVVGYFSLFDLGLGRALTNLVAQKLATGEDNDLPALIWTANVLMLALGLVGVVVFAAASPLVVHRVLKIAPSLQPEILKSFLILSLTVPFVVSTTGFRGVLEAKQKFKVINGIRVPLGIITFLAPLAVLPFSSSLVPIVVVLAIARAVFCGVYVGFAFRSVPALRYRFAVDRTLLPRLLSFGGWMTVSNIISPIMMYFDRFLIGSLVSLTAVAYYATPYEISTKLLLVPASIVGVLFPAFSTALASNPSRAKKLYDRALRTVGLGLLPIVLGMMIFARPGLTLWLGHDFAAHSTSVMQWISLGVLLNGIALIPFSLIQGAGRADITGKVHFLELPPYVAALIVCTSHLGITGAAIVWAARTGVDLGLLLLAAKFFIFRSNNLGVLRNDVQLS